MPFRDSNAMEERVALFRDYETKAFTVSELCERYGISRQTFYAWKQRRESGEARWFEARSHATESCPHSTDGRLVERIIAKRREYPRLGPKKIRCQLVDESKRRDETVTWPAASTIGDILKREGLVAEKRRRRRPLQPRGEIIAPATMPNEEWAIDFKGWFRTLDGRRCDPLTITDQASRYLIEVRIVAPTWAAVRAAMERVFAMYGLPLAIRSDNGSPFGSTGAGGLSALSVWWLLLGIEPHYIPPASPQHNGRHERMHRTLKEETSKPPSATLAEQQQRFDVFRRFFNEERPHEAIGQLPPARMWTPPTRALPRRIEDPWYDADHQVRRVRPQGTIKWGSEEIFIGEAFVGTFVGIAAHQDAGHIVRFCGRDLGIIDRDRRFRRFAPPRARLRVAPETTMTAEH